MATILEWWQAGWREGSNSQTKVSSSIHPSEASEKRLHQVIIGETLEFSCRVCVTVTGEIECKIVCLVLFCLEPLIRWWWWRRWKQSNKGALSVASWKPSLTSSFLSVSLKSRRTEIFTACYILTIVLCLRAAGVNAVIWYHPGEPLSRSHISEQMTILRLVFRTQVGPAGSSQRTAASWDVLGTTRKGLGCVAQLTGISPQHSTNASIGSQGYFS